MMICWFDGQLELEWATGINDSVMNPSQKTKQVWPCQCQVRNQRAGSIAGQTLNLDDFQPRHYTLRASE